jgi:predicted dehydrogenase
MDDGNRSDAVRVGIVGAGANTRPRHVPGLRALAGIEIVSVCNRSRESSERVAREFGIPRVARDRREVVEADDTEAVARSAAEGRAVCPGLRA